MCQSLSGCQRYKNEAPSLIGGIHTYLNNYKVVNEILKEIYKVQLGLDNGIINCAKESQGM